MAPWKAENLLGRPDGGICQRVSFGIAKNQPSRLQKKAVNREVLFQREHVIDLVGDPAGFWIFLAIKPYRRAVLEKLGLQGPANWAWEGNFSSLDPRVT